MGAVVFWTLTVLAVIDALGVALLVSRSRIEQFVVAVAVFFGLTASPALLLGYLEILTRPRLAATALAELLVLLVGLTRITPARLLLRQVWEAIRAVARLPLDAVRECLRVRSLIAVGVGWGVLLAAYAFFEAWRVPNVDWDALIYHEPIIGFALQNHGFSMVDLPLNASTQAINGYPKLCEMTALWFVVFTDKTLIELPNVLSYPALAAAAYLIIRRFTDRLSAMGWTTALVFMPQIWTQLCMIAIDVEVAFFATLALHFSTRPNMRVRDAWCTWLALGLLVASKGSGMAIAGACGSVASVRLLRAQRTLTTVITVGCGVVALGGIAAVPLVRDWHAFHDPLWPVTIDVGPIHWKGILPLRELVVDQPLRETFRSYYENPGAGLGDVIRHGFGYAIPWLVFPLAALGLLLAPVRLFVTRTATMKNLGWIILLGISFTLTTPTLGRNARYNIHILVCVLVVAAWVISEPKWNRLREGVLGAVTVLSILPLFWMNEWLWSWGAAEELSFLNHPLGDRLHLEHPRFDHLAKQRDEELGPGDVAAVDEGTLFIGALWNSEFSNEVKLVHCGGDSRDCLKNLDLVHAKWVCASLEQTRKTLDASRSWEKVGKMTSEDDTAVYRAKR